MTPRMIAAAALMLGVLANPTGSHAQSVEAFYQGKSLRLIVGTHAGDGYDVWSRLLARHIGRHVPGRPGVIVQNMPGAGTITAANYVFNIAPRDGTVFTSLSRSLPTQALLNRPNIKFDPRQVGWLGSGESANRVCTVSAQSKTRTIDDVFVRETLMGGTGAGMVPTFLPTFLNNLLGTKFRVVEGYGGASAIFLAMERGELDGICMSSSTLFGPRFDLIKSGKLRVLFNMEARRLAAMPEVPTMFDRLKDLGQRQLVSLVNAALEYGRPFATPPGVPPERLAALRAAFRATLDDPAFKADAAKLRYRITYTSPQEMEEVTARIYALPREIIEKAATMMPNE